MYKTAFRISDRTLPPAVAERCSYGWTVGERYNACAVPYFEPKETNKILQALKELSWFCEDAEYGAEYDEFIFWYDVELKYEGRFQGVEISTSGGCKKVYPIGAWEWPWLAGGDEEGV